VVRAVGWVTRAGRRLVETAGLVLDGASGLVLATATGLYVAADDARKQELRRRYGWRPLGDPTR
jgi:hypothetical protein